jgi:hypothetical protein
MLAYQHAELQMQDCWAWYYAINVMNIDPDTKRFG